MIRIFNRYVSARGVTLFALEGLLITMALWCSMELWRSNAAAPRSDLPVFVWQTASVVALIQIVFYYNRLYDLVVCRSRAREVRQLVVSAVAAVVLYGLLAIALPELSLAGEVFLATLILTVVSVPLLRVGMERAWPTAAASPRILIVGTGQLALAVGRELAKRKDLQAQLAGFVGEPPTHDVGMERFGSRGILGRTSEIDTITTRHRASRIIVALEDWRGTLPMDELMKLRVGGVVIEDAHTALARLTGRIWLEGVRPSWLTFLIFSDGFWRSRLIAGVKRVMDLCFGLLGLVVSAPVMLLAALAIWLESGGPVIYRQTRVGWRGGLFDLLKFRSMRADAEESGVARWAEENDPRVTPVGRFLRRYRLDELPQFINVIRGDMSFVGPRPERPFFVEQLKSHMLYYDLRHTVRPGITGWAQVRHPYAASVEDSLRKLEYDFFYLKNMSPLFDCSIVLETIGAVLWGRGSR